MSAKDIDAFFDITQTDSDGKFSYAGDMKEDFEKLLDQHLEYVNPNYGNCTILHRILSKVKKIVNDIKRLKYNDDNIF